MSVPAYPNHLYFAGDTIENLEIGTKLSLFDNRLRVIGTIYQMDWQDIIVAGCLPDEIIITRPCISGSSVRANAGHAYSDGWTLDVAWTPTTAYSSRRDTHTRSR